jgi:hypothetical protein
VDQRFTRRWVHTADGAALLHVPIVKEVGVAIIDADVHRAVRHRCSRVVGFMRVFSIGRSGTQVRGALKRLVRYAWKQGSRWSGGHLTF